MATWRGPGSSLRIDPRLFDVLVALPLVVVAQIDVWAPWGDGTGAAIANQPLGAVFALASTLPLVLRRRVPFPVLLAVMTALLGESLFVSRGALFFGGLFPMLLATYSVAAFATPRLSLAGVALSAAAVTAVTRRDPKLDSAGELFFDLLFVFAVWTVGRVVGRHGARADALEAEREVRAQRAVADERTRIARELHDVIAHAVSVMIVQAGAAERVLGDEVRARAALGAVRESGSEALAELRRLVGILREQGDELSLTPQPGIGELDALLEQVRAGGFAVDLSVEGEPVPLPPGVDLAAYRIVQEALTNVRKHARNARAELRLTYRPRLLELSIVDDGRSMTGNGATHQGGHGLVGMRERAALYGGTIEAGPRPQGGYAVEARLPLEERT